MVRRGLPARIVAGGFAVIVGTFGGAVAAEPATGVTLRLDRVVAVVGDDIVLRSELDKALVGHPLYQEALSQIPANASEDVRNTKIREVEGSVLDELIDLALLKAEAVRFDIRVNDADLERATVDLARQYGMSVEELRAQVEASPDAYGNWADYQADLRDQILQYKVPHYLATWSVSDAQVREHYRKLMRDESAKVEVVQFTFAAKSNSSADRDRAFAQAQTLARKLRSKEDADVAAEADGSVPRAERTIGRGDIAPALEDALFQAKDGQIVGPIASGKGYVVFKVVEHVESAALSYEEAKGRIRDQLENEAFFKAQSDLKQQLRSRAHIDIRL